MSSAQAPAPTWTREVAAEFNMPELAWVRDDTPAFIAIANITPGASVLIFNCISGNILLEVIKSIGYGYGPIISIDDRSEHLQQLASTLRSEGWTSNIQLFLGDLAHLDAITALHYPNHIGSNLTFDIILVLIPIPLVPSLYPNLLSSLTVFLSSPNGIIAIQLHPRIDESHFVARIQAVDLYRSLIASFSFVFEYEWEAVEQGFTIMAESASLGVDRIQRLSLSDVPVVDLSELFEKIMIDV